MANLRDIVRNRANSCCEYCQLPDFADEWAFHVDHVIAHQHGGSDEVDNLCWSCSRCNLTKGPNVAGIDLKATEPVRLFNPRLDAWHDHFRFKNARIVGKTTIGRVTARLLAMNTTSRVELRRRLVDAGEL